MKGKIVGISEKTKFAGSMLGVFSRHIIALILSLPNYKKFRVLHRADRKIC